MPNTRTILVTGVGAPGTRGTLYALRQNREDLKLRFVGTDLKEGVVGKFFVDSFYKVQAPENGSYIDEINSICQKEGVDVIVPQTTRETAAFSENIKKLNVPVTTSDASATRRANNKFELLKLFEELHLPYPKYFKVKDLSDLIDKAEELGYPDKAVVVKPPVSHGSRGFRVLRENTSWTIRRFLSEKPGAGEISLDELSKILTRDEHVDFPELLVTEFLPGKEYSVDAFQSKNLSIAIPRLRKEIVNGISFETILDLGRNDIAEYTLKAAKALGLKFAFGFQFKLDYSDLPKVLECNPRVQGTMVASLFSGVNIIWMAVKEALGEPQKELPKKLDNASFHRFWGGVGLSEDGKLLGEI